MTDENALFSVRTSSQFTVWFLNMKTEAIMFFFFDSDLK